MKARALESAFVAGTAEYRERLLSVMDRKDHPSYWSLMGPGTARDQLLVHYCQEWAVYVRDFPVFLSRVHAATPRPDVRRELAENLYEEETGRISGGAPHGELFLHMMEGLGFSRRSFNRVRLLPASRAYRRFLDEATTSAPWIVGLAVTTIFVEGSRNDRSEIASRVRRPAARPTLEPPSKVSAMPSVDDSIDRLLQSCKFDEEQAGGGDPLASDPLVVHHGLDPQFLELKRVHRKVEGSHRLSAWTAVLTHARSAEDQSRVVSALDLALDLWLGYRDGVSRAARL